MSFKVNGLYNIMMTTKSDIYKKPMLIEFPYAHDFNDNLLYLLYDTQFETILRQLSVFWILST